MNRIIYYILALLVIGFIQACTHEEEDIFDDSSANRMNEAVQEYREILTNAKNGWLMEYYAETEPQKMGGYNILCKFDENGEVTLAAEFATANYDIGERVVSWYQVKPNQGPILTFDTYNELIHLFSTPSSSDFDGYDGDFEFVFMNVTNDSIVLKGKKNKLDIVLTRNSDSFDWDKYLEEVNQIITATEIYSLFKVELDGVEIGSCTMNNKRLYTFTLGDETIMQNAIFTPTGIKFYKPLKLGGNTVRNFKWDEETKQYVCEDQSNIVLIVNKLPSYLYYEEFIGTYLFEYKEYTNTERKTKVVDLVEFENGNSLILKGAVGFDITLLYDRTTGTLAWLTQGIGISGANTIVACPWDTDAGYFSWGASVGMNSLLNIEELENGKINFKFVDNGVWSSYKANAIILWLFNSQGESQSIYNGGGARFIDIEMTKQ